MSSNTSKSTVSDWEHLRTKETRNVEHQLRAHFNQVDSYRYNSASIRLRIIDQQIKGMSHEQRDELIEPFLSALDEKIQADLMNVLVLYPDEVHESTGAYLFNEEFEHPTKSML